MTGSYALPIRCSALVVHSQNIAGCMRPCKKAVLKADKTWQESLNLKIG